MAMAARTVSLYMLLAICFIVSACNGLPDPHHCHPAIRGAIYQPGACVIHTI